MSGEEEKKAELEGYEPLPEHEPKDLVFDTPDADAPGFLRRQTTMVKFMHQFEEAERTRSLAPGLIDDMVEFLLGFVTIPEDRDEAREILLDLSQNQYLYVMTTLQTGGDLVPPTKESP